MAKTEIYRCKYLLPCSYCDKYDIPCKAKREDLVNYSVLHGEISEEVATDIKNALNCNHDWRYEGTGFNNSSSAYEIHRCNKCGMTKEVKIEAL